MEYHSIQEEEEGEVKYKLYKSRFWILFVYSLLSFNQSLLWITFSPIADSTREYFNTSNTIINFWLATGCIVYIPVVFVTSWLLEKPNGLRIAIFLTGAFEIIASVIRCFTVFDPKTSWSIVLITIAQVINAAVGPLVMATPSLVSGTWFGEGERTTATAIASLNNNFGAAAGFLVGPYIVEATSIPVLLYVEAAFSVLIAFGLVYFPSKPPSPPSPSASVIKKSNLKGFLNDLKVTLRNPTFVFLILIGGGTGGVFNAWSGMLDILLGPIGYSETIAGWLGFTSTIALILGGIVCGILGDTIFKRRFKELLICLFVLSGLLFIWFSISLPSIFSSSPIVPPWEWSLFVSIIGAGLFLGATNPLFYELSVELTYPISEGTSAGLLTLVNNMGCLIFLGLTPLISATWVNILMVGSVLLSMIIMIFIPIVYRRSETKVLEKAQQPESFT